MVRLDRTDRSLIARWWWTVDRPLLLGLSLLALSGLVFVLASSPPVASRLGLPPLHFAGRHLLYLTIAALLLLGTSLLSPKGVHRIATGLLAVGLVLLLLIPAIGFETKGAQRWLSLGTFLIQPSEFVKPALIVITAGLLARSPGIGNVGPVAVLTSAIVLLLLAQPDVGMAMIVLAVFGLQLFLAGLPWILVLAAGALGLGVLWQAYLWFPHVADRIDRFIDPTSGDTYQIGLALDAIRGAAWFGSGPGEGRVKYVLPDAHSDFVFAVIAEEFGLVSCLALLILFGFIMLRGLARTQGADDRFTLLAAGGLLGLFAVQALINVAVNLSIVPATGMTLPFISYGGSSLCALAIAMGFFFALTRRRSTGAAA